MSNKVGPTFVPGDPIMYIVQFTCKANVRTVLAVFVAEESGDEVILEGEVEKKKERAWDSRLQTALLKRPGEPPRTQNPAPTTCDAWRCTPTRAGRWTSIIPPKGASACWRSPQTSPYARTWRGRSPNGTRTILQGDGSEVLLSK